jgi:hypothetical protein
MLNDKIKKNSTKTYLSHSELSRQTRDLGHDTKITL